jgi:hypothetical protein
MNVPVHVEDQIISDMIITAFEQGVGYWVRGIKVFDKEGKQRRGLTDDPLNNLSSITVVEDEDGTEHEFRISKPTPFAQIITGLAHMAKAYPRHFANVVSDDHDAETADVFIQCCLFADIRYS